MGRKHGIAHFVFIVLILVEVVALTAVWLHGYNFEVLNPGGMIADKERGLMIFAALLSIVVVVPVFVMLFVFSWKYREGNPAAEYRPDWDHNRAIEAIWWLVPFGLIMILASVMWRATHELDPYKPLASTKPAVTVQVIALQWKWLFIYPEQQIATVNYFRFPEDTPLNFEITSDAPMNSFWIPQLGGQVYAMSGMSTELHLMANSTGSYRGSSANISGQGFAGMKFIAESTSRDDFDGWVKSVKQSDNKLDLAQYQKLVKPSEDNPRATYVATEHNLYNEVVMKYMGPMASTDAAEHEDHH